jgi:hypothetical protein
MADVARGPLVAGPNMADKFANFAATGKDRISPPSLEKLHRLESVIFIIF